MRYHCELAWLGGDRAAADVLVEEVDGHITAVTAGVPPPATARRLAGLTLPGLANAHSHAFHRALRSRAQGRGSFWTWREQMYALAGALDPDGLFRVARAVYAEMVLAGITCVGEFHYLHHGPDGHPYDDPTAMAAALAAAAADAEIRLTLLDACYLRGGIGAPPTGVQRRFSDGDVDAWAARVEAAAARLASPTVRMGAAVHSVRAVEPRHVAEVAAVAARHGWPLHAHVSEQPGEQAACLEAYGTTPTGLLSQQGALSTAFTAVHATHATDQDVAALGAAGATACLCPTTERDLADGIGPGARLLAAGARLAVGTDAHVLVEPFEELRALELHERLVTGERGHFTAGTLLGAATLAGHRSLGWPEAGVLAPGAPADLVTVRLDTVRTAGVGAAHALEAAVFAASAADVDHVVVHGRTVVEGGRHRRLDVAAELAGAVEAIT